MKHKFFDLRMAMSKLGYAEKYPNPALFIKWVKEYKRDDIYKELVKEDKKCKKDYDSKNSQEVRARKQKVKDAKDELKNIKWSEINTLAKLKPIVKSLAKYVDNL